MDHLGESEYRPNPVLEKALDVLFLIHADHELNASATTVLQTGSSLVDPYSAIAYVQSLLEGVSLLMPRQCWMCFALVRSFIFRSLIPLTDVLADPYMV